MKSANIRFIEKDDVLQVMEAENASHVYYDPDFEVDSVRPWAFTKDKLMKVIQQHFDPVAGTYDTRTWIVEVPLENDPEGRVECQWVCGACTIELHPDKFDCLWVTIHPKAPKEVGRQIVSFLERRAQRSATRKSVVVHIPDGDYHLVKLFQDAGWELSFVKDYFDPHDAWKFTYDALSSQDNDRGEQTNGVLV